MQLCSSCQVNTHFFMVKHMGISSLQHSLDWSITLQVLKKKVWKFFHHYLRPIPLDSSLRPYHIPTYHFSEKHLTPPAPFQFPRPHGPYP